MHVPEPLFATVPVTEPVPVPEAKPVPELAHESVPEPATLTLELVLRVLLLFHSTFFF